MKSFVAVIALICLSVAATAQDIKFQLANATSKKWIGANVYANGAKDNNTTLTFFYKSLTMVEGDKNNNSTKPAVKWWLVSGEYANDNNIVVIIGKHKYAVEFSRTNNGKDFMTLTRVPEHEDEEPVMKTYVAE